MANLLDLTAQLVSAHASNTQMTSDQLYKEIETVYASLKALESGVQVETAEQPKQLSIKQAFKNDVIICMICNKGFKTLKRHLAQAHDLKPGQYRKQFNIPSTMSLTAKSYSESRRQTAIDKGLGDGLVKARATRKANSDAKVNITPAKKVKASVPAVSKKTAVPAKIEVKAPVKAKKAAAPVKAEIAKAPVSKKPVAAKSSKPAAAKKK
jgi:predicted transcriptional regulator